MFKGNFEGNLNGNFTDPDHQEADSPDPDPGAQTQTLQIQTLRPKPTPVAARKCSTLNFASSVDWNWRFNSGKDVQTEQRRFMTTTNELNWLN